MSDPTDSNLGDKINECVDWINEQEKKTFIGVDEGSPDGDCTVKGWIDKKGTSFHTATPTPGVESVTVTLPKETEKCPYCEYYEVRGDCACHYLGVKSGKYVVVQNHPSIQKQLQEIICEWNNSWKGIGMTGLQVTDLASAIINLLAKKGIIHE